MPQQKWQHNRAARLLACDRQVKDMAQRRRPQQSLKQVGQQKEQQRQRQEWSGWLRWGNKNEVAGRRWARCGTGGSWWTRQQLQQQIFVYELTANILRCKSNHSRMLRSVHLLPLYPPLPNQPCNNKQAEITSKTVWKSKLRRIAKK